MLSFLWSSSSAMTSRIGTTTRSSAAVRASSFGAGAFGLGFYWVYPGQSDYSDFESDGEEPGRDGSENPNQSSPSGSDGDSAAAAEVPEEERQGPRGRGSARAGPAKRQQLRFKFRVGWQLFHVPAPTHGTAKPSVGLCCGPVMPSSGYRAFLTRTGGLPVESAFVLTWDASTRTHERTALLLWWEALAGRRVCSSRRGPPVQQSPSRPIASCRPLSEPHSGGAATATAPWGGGSPSYETRPNMCSRHCARAAPVRDQCRLARWASHSCESEPTSTRCECT